MALKLIYFFKRYRLKKDMYIKSENMTVMLGSNVTDLIKTIFNFVFSEYRNSLFEKMKGSDFNFQLCPVGIHNSYRRPLDVQRTSDAHWVMIKLTIVVMR